uniref:Tegument protein UL7 n=1 Tax=Human betaherpesvirus 6A TaxID=32603 RepID=A0A140AKA2_9BETA|nr:tegument protein UL7 [Human betaherpesvirus 6A]APO38544.1 tegument protein UL7 [Human betaherpesvirus 6A]APO39053.1 tegument protein UL7 [Human betaherpesvirus 6A]APO39133.1 tegument protein UL7 [Human betaherpesvirus 6A]APO39213.1 tegument protein UL7 [Human betaherpesvirus 6A]
MKSLKKLKELETSDVFNILHVRTILKVIKIDKCISLARHPLVNITVGDDGIWFHLEDGTTINGLEYKTICEKELGFQGFIGIIILDSEDTLQELRLNPFQFKRRLIHMKVDTPEEFMLCGLVFALENLPLKQSTLHKLIAKLVLFPALSPITKILFNTCDTLVCTLRHIFFNEHASEILHKVPLMIRLYNEMKNTHIEVLELYFNTKRSHNFINLSLESRQLQDSSLQVIQLATQFAQTFYSKNGDTSS